MSRWLTCFALTLLAAAPWAATAQDEDLFRPRGPKTQQDIIREREEACRGLTGQARTECLDSYVGPKERGEYRGWRQPARPRDRPGRV